MGFRRTIVLLVIALGVSAPACGGSSESASVVIGAGNSLFPADSLRHWVSYADHVAVYQVVAARELPARPEDLEHGGGLQSREVDLRIESVLWSAADAPELPPTISMEALGWAIVEDGERLPALASDGPRVEVGERYVAPLALVKSGTGRLEWWPLAAGAQLPVRDGSVVRSDRVRWHSAALGALETESLTALRARLTEQAPEPLAKKYAELRPKDRVEAVARERQGAAFGGESE